MESFSKLLVVSTLIFLNRIITTEAYRDSHLSSEPCDPSSANFDNTIIFASLDATELAEKKTLYPSDGYLSWAEKNKANYDNSVFVSSTADVCQGVGFHWSVNTDTTDSHITIAAAFYIGESSSSAGSGYGAIGFSETGGMRGADVVYFTFEDSNPNSTAKLIDAHILDSLTKPIHDEQQDWTLLDHGVSDDGYLIFEMTRKLDSSDSFDREFVNDSPTFVEDHKLIAAWNRSPTVTDVMYHGNNRARTSIQLFDSNDSEVAPGLDYDGFKKEMEDRSDGSVDLAITSFNIPQVETYYHEECYSTSEMINKGLFENKQSSAQIIGYEFLIQLETFKYMHHIVFFGHNDEDGCSQFQRSPIFVWTPGEDFLYFPSNTGFILGGDNGFKSFTMQYHIDNKDYDAGKIDTGSGIRLYTTTKETIDVEVGMMQIGDPFVMLGGERIGQGLSKHVFECPSSCTQKSLNVDKITVIKEGLHMHGFGKRIVNQIVRNDEVIHEGFIDYWDFDQSGTPAPQQNPFQIRKGDVMRTICYYDTESYHKIEFGVGSSDEMCMSFIMYYPKQPLETCGVSYFDSNCETDYVGATALSSAEDFGRQFGNGAGNQEQSCSDNILEVTPAASKSSVKIKIKPTNATLHIEISADANAWLGFGINAEGLMIDSDAIIGSPSLGVSKYRLENSRDRSGVRKLEEEKQTLVETSFIQDSVSSTMIFTKLLNDGNDTVISLEEKMTFIYAVGHDNDLTGHAESGSITISLKTCEVDDTELAGVNAAFIKKSLVIHGFAGIIVFGAFVPVALLSARLRKCLDCKLFRETQAWFVIHMSLMILSFLSIVVVFGVAVNAKIKKEGSHFQGSHEIIGLVVMVLITIQVVVGIFRPPKSIPHAIGYDRDTEDPKNNDEEVPSPKRKQWKRVHVVLGVLTFGCGIYQIISGLPKFEELYGHGIFTILK